jgi:hypothetical protein
VHDHSCGLVYYEEGLVLVDDAYRDVLTNDRALFYFWDFDPDRLASFRAVARLLASSVDENVTLGNQRRRLGPRKASALGDKQIEADIAVRLDGKILAVTQGLDLRLRIRYRSWSHDTGRGSLLSP